MMGDVRNPETGNTMWASSILNSMLSFETQNKKHIISHCAISTYNHTIHIHSTFTLVKHQNEVSISNESYY